ncbi:hypothetical protein [Methylobacterium planeticum]|uniref:Uncharacterized protein n=1 Tax=Methylobacterium planeticum TaxID=2615211 RepID=A0A6N6MCY7_9HYPH|nr:hypothetical protein [Methylobacterium planeticum]KAB1068483.1 hypothetical protein F6X51_26865 [Methylobacterium planeticum]
MLWATRLLDAGEGIGVEELFAGQSAALGSPRDMMLLAVDEAPARRRVFVGVPDPNLLDCYSGFEACLRRDVPRAPTLVAGDQGVFQAMFQSGG